MFERTVRTAVTLEGRGLHTGSFSRTVLKPASEGSGIRFVRGGEEFGAASLEEADRRTRAGKGATAVETVEHLLAACYGLGVTNLRIEVDGPELPALDGSAAGFVEALGRAGVETQSRPREAYRVPGPMFVSAPNAAIAVFPHDGFRVTYTLDYPHPALQAQTVAFEVDEATFVREIAPARTFCTDREAEELRAKGFGLGADTTNTLVMTAHGPVGNKLRFSDECARHKVLDLIGDLALTGVALQGHVVAVRSGHALNRQMVRMLSKEREHTI